MTEKDKIEQLFDSVRQAPTELSRSRVEAMIEGFSSLDAEANPEPGAKPFLNFKNIIIMSIPISIAIGLMLFLPSKKEEKTAIQNENIVIENPGFIHENKDEEILVDSTKSRLSFEFRQEDVSMDKTDENSLEKEIPGVVEPTIISTSDAVNPKSNTATRPQIQKRKSLGSQMDIIEPIKTEVPEWSALKMRKIKRRLYKNLLKDKIILSKGVAVEMDLPGDKIIVNGKELDDGLFLKYAELTKDVGTGPVRKIKMNRQYIKIGDFHPDGFKGSGYGTFVEDFGNQKDCLFAPEEPKSDELFPSKKDIDLRNELLEEELKKRDLFADDILSEKPREQGRRRLFSPNVSYKKMNEMHQKLYDMLLAHAFIENSSEFALIELSKDSYLINGKKLNDSQYGAYKTLLTEYGIKQVMSRQIRLSKHSISVGDYAPGSFSGSTTTFDIE